MNSKFKILVVDDDLKNIQVGINFLKQNENYHLLFATSGKQALDRVKETNFDLVLLDILMPAMDGYEVCRRLKADEKTRHIPVIFLTAKHDDESLIKGFELGGADYITKPFKAQELNARVKTHLELHYHYHQEINKLQQVLIASQKAETTKFIAGGIAHDCRNFMGAISGNLFLLESKMKEDNLPTNGYDSLLQGANSAVSSVLDLLQQFFTFSCKDKTLRETVDMNEVVSDLKKVYKEYQRHSIVFDIKMLSGQSFVVADKLHVVQVLLNILINAQHAIVERSPERRETGKISLTINKAEGSSHTDLDETCDYLVVTVEDNGIGMTAKTIDKIFDPFFTTRDGRGGSGLGLAVSLKIVQSHKGTIKVESEPGKGTRFMVYFPCHASEEETCL